MNEPQAGRTASADRYQNPFSASRVRPGAVPFVFPPGEDATVLLDRFDRLGGRCQILGPHGSGKSTLVAALVAELAARRRHCHVIALHDRQRRLPVERQRLATLACGGVLIVDGYEQLGWWARRKLQRQCERRKWGLVVTAHAPVGLPTLATTGTTPELAQALVERLLPGAGPISVADVAERFARHGGNLREILFDLYDLYEARRPAGSSKTAG